MDKQPYKSKKQFRFRIARLIIGTLVIMVTILLLLESNHNYFQEVAIKSQQENILNIVTTVSSQLETYFNTKDSYLKSILSEPMFISEFQALKEDKTKDATLANLMFRMGRAEYLSIELIDNEGNLLKAYTDNPHYQFQQGEDVIKAINTENVIYHVDTLGVRSINIIQPIKSDGILQGFARMQLNSDYIYDVYLADYQLNQKGYISIKDMYGRLLLHPSMEHLGEDVLEVRKKQYPNYDWSELESLVQIQLRKETGVGMYHSIWPGDGTRVKKINGFTPCNIGDTFIILNFSIDYKETMHPFESITGATIFISILLIIISLLAIIYIYIVELKRNELALESVYFEDLKEKNAMIMHQAKFASMGEMTATIAHQLKQPLNALKISLYNVEDYHLLGEDDKAYLDILLKSNHRLIDKISKTIDDFKFFFKPQEQSSIFTIGEVIEFAIELNSERLKNLEIKVKIFGDRDVKLLGESNVLAQVILNLINNSIDALKDADGIGEIDFHIKESEKDITILLTDTGGGIKQEVMAKLFEPYVTTKGDNGTGLGLYISRYILREKFNGELFIVNDRSGIKATIQLPKFSD